MIFKQTLFTLERNNVLTVPTKALRFIPDESALLAMNISVAGAGREMPNGAGREMPNGGSKEMPNGKKIVWVKENNTLVPRLVAIGTSSMNLTEVIDGLSENDEIVTDLTADMAAQPSSNPAPRSPFMPGPPQQGRR